MNRSLLASAFILGATASPLRASPLVVDEVLASAHAHHPGLQATRTATDRAEAQMTAADGPFDPRVRTRTVDVVTGYYDHTTVDADARVLLPVFGITPFVGWRLGRGSFPSYDDKQRTLELGEVRAGVEIPLLQGLTIDRARAARTKARIGLDVASAEIRGRELDIHRDAALAYWDWVAAGHRLRVRETQLALALERARQLQQSVAAGQRAPVELTDNERLVLVREGLVISATRDLQKTAFDLSIYLRDDRGSPRVPDLARRPDLAAPPSPSTLERDLDDAIRLAASRAPRLAELARRRDIAATDAALARNQLLPQLTVSAMATQGLGAADPTLPDRSSAAVAAGITFELPIGMHAARGALALAGAEQRRLGAEQRLLTDRIAADVRALHADLTAARARHALALRNADLAEQLATAERTRFARGDSTIVLVNIREEAAADAALQAVDAHADVLRARARYLVLLGELPR